jgi:hypothetical protein
LRGSKLWWLDKAKSRLAGWSDESDATQGDDNHSLTFIQHLQGRSFPSTLSFEALSGSSIYLLRLSRTFLTPTHARRSAPTLTLEFSNIPVFSPPRVCTTSLVIPTCCESCNHDRRLLQACHCIEPRAWWASSRSARCQYLLKPHGAHTPTHTSFREGDGRATALPSAGRAISHLKVRRESWVQADNTHQSHPRPPHTLTTDKETSPGTTSAYTIHYGPINRKSTTTATSRHDYAPVIKRDYEVVTSRPQHLRLRAPRPK